MPHDNHVAVLRTQDPLVGDEGLDDLGRGSCRICRSRPCVEQAQPIQTVQGLVRGTRHVLDRFPDVAAVLGLGGQERPCPVRPRHALGPGQACVVPHHAQLHQEVPRLAESCAAQGASNEGLHLCQSVQFSVSERIAVGVTVVGAPIHFDGRQRLEGAVGRHDPHAALIEEGRGPSLTGEHHVSGVPAQLVMPGVVVGIRRHQAAAVRLKTEHAPSLLPDFVDDLHGTHVVDARIQAELVQDQNPGLPRRTVQRFHLRRDVARGDHVDPCLDGHRGHVHMHEGRQHADDKVGLCDAGIAVYKAIGRQLKRMAPRMATHLGLGRLQAQITHVNLPPLLVCLTEQMRDQRRTAAPCTEDQNHLAVCHACKVARQGLARALPRRDNPYLRGSTPCMS